LTSQISSAPEGRCRSHGDYFGWW